MRALLPARSFRIAHGDDLTFDFPKIVSLLSIESLKTFLQAGVPASLSSMPEKTIFQKIIDREIPAPLVYEDDLVAAFNDINPQAPVHVLIVPKKVIPRVGEAVSEDQATLGALLLAAGKIAEKLGVKERDKGFRLVINHGKDAGETVPHMHVHLLAGRDLAWPPG